MKVWLEGGPLKINREIIQRGTRYPTLVQPKSIKSGTQKEIENLTKVK